MKPTGRKAHLLFACVALEMHRTKQRLPRSRDLALVADVHPATARRWLHDLRSVMGQKASALTHGTQEKARA